LLCKINFQQALLISKRSDWSKKWIKRLTKQIEINCVVKSPRKDIIYSVYSIYNVFYLRAKQRRWQSFLFFFLTLARLRRNLARWRYQDSNHPVRPESAIQLWVDGRIIHVVSHRRGPVVNLSHLHNRVPTAPSLSKIRTNRKIRSFAVVSPLASTVWMQMHLEMKDSASEYRHISLLNSDKSQKIRICAEFFVPS